MADVMHILQLGLAKRTLGISNYYLSRTDLCFLGGSSAMIFFFFFFSREGRYGLAKGSLVPVDNAGV